MSTIRMKGFKTFARPTELVFEQGVSVIIGPNGSGKSNIADAVLWALGEQSPSQLRGRSMQDVIFSGSDGQKAAAVAEVALVFDNASGIFPLEFGEIEIKRRVLRDGSSEYRINGAPSRLLDVQDLAAGVGLGREMHSVISQGKVDELVNSTPAIRRALVEEAAGLGRYKKRRDRTLAKLEKVRANLARVSDVEREVRAALRPLKQQVTAAERHAEATEDVARIRAQVAFAVLVGLEVDIERERGRLEEVAARRREADEELAGIRRERRLEEERFTAALQERESLSAVYHQAKADIDRIGSREAVLRQRLSRHEADLFRARRRRELAEVEERTARERAAGLGSTPSSAGRLQIVLQAEAARATRLDDVRPKLRMVSDREESLKDQVFGLEAERARALQERDFLARELDARTRRAEELAAQARAGGERLEEVRGAVAERRTEVAVAEEVVARAEKDEAAARERLAAAREELAAVREHARRAADDVAATASRIRVLEEVAARREGAPAAARALAGAHAGAVLVVEALRVRKGYERAVAAALGPLASAVVLPGPGERELLTQGEGPLELLWPGEYQAAGDLPGAGESTAHGGADAGAATTAEPPGINLWDVVDGPSGLLAVLRQAVPHMRVVGAGEAPDGRWPGCLVTTDGHVWVGLHQAARRGEAAAEAILTAAAELDELRARREGLEQEAGSFVRHTEESEGVLRAAEEAMVTVGGSLREARKGRDSLVDEVSLWQRRAEEAEAEAADALERVRRDAELAAEMEAGLVSVGRRLEGSAAGLEAARGELRSAKEEGEALRAEALALEAKRAQAAVLAVKLRERERAREEEHERARRDVERARTVLADVGAREESLAVYLPVLGSLHEVTAALARTLSDRAEALRESVERSRAATDGFGDALKDQGRREADLQRTSSELSESLVATRVALAHLEEKAGARREELDELRRRHLSPREVDAVSVEGLDLGGLEIILERAERRRERIGPVNPLAEQEYRETEERATFLAEQRQDLDRSLTELRSVIRDLDDHIETTFREVFEATRGHFEEMVGILFPGGKGVLKLVAPEVAASETPAGPGDEDDDDDERASTAGPGIALEIKPPRKAPRSMSLLSGGEKALAAIAFLFGLFLARPCPFYVLDEVEAALDDLNLGRFLSLVRRYQDRTQFIVITHQRRTMEIADRLYGVAMDADGTSRVLSRRLTAAGGLGREG
ncbi:MAG: chromosome segregation SMC family protein [Thermoleophilia bacterium]